MTAKVSLMQGLKVFPPFGGRDVICLNFSADQLKMAYGRVYHSRRELVDLAVYKIQGLSDEDIAKAIQTSLERLKLKEPEVIIIIPAHLTITRNIEIPSLNQGEIREIVDLQAGRHTPYSREEIIIDYIHVGTYRENYTKILLIIVTLSVVRRQIAILAKAGLKTEKIFFAPEAMSSVCLNVLELEQKDAVQTIAHLDLNFTDFINVTKGKLIFVRSIPIGTQHLLSEPERYQMRFLEEIKKSLEAYQSEDIDQTPKELLLTGAGEGSLELQKVLNDHLHISVKRVSPYLKQLPHLSDALKDLLTAGESSLLDVAAPLITASVAIVNFIPEEIKLRKMFQEKSRDLIKLGVLAMTALALVCLLLAGNILFKNIYLKNLTEKYRPIIESAKALEKNFSQIQMIKQEFKGQNLALEVLVELYNLIPSNVQLRSIKFSREGKFSIEGYARAMNIVFSLVDAMEESPYFTKVEPRKTTKSIKDNEELVDFEITCLLE